MGLLLKERICSLWEQILSFKSSPQWERVQMISMFELLPLEVYPLPFLDGFFKNLSFKKAVSERVGGQASGIGCHLRFTFWLTFLKNRSTITLDVFLCYEVYYEVCHWNNVLCHVQVAYALEFPAHGYGLHRTSASLKLDYVKYK